MKQGMHTRMESTTYFIELWLFYARQSKKIYHSLEDLFLLVSVEVMEAPRKRSCNKNTGYFLLPASI